jgi:hypothetical protein
VSKERNDRLQGSRRYRKKLCSFICGNSPQDLILHLHMGRINFRFSDCGIDLYYRWCKYAEACCNGANCVWTHTRKANVVSCHREQRSLSSAKNQQVMLPVQSARGTRWTSNCKCVCDACSRTVCVSCLDDCHATSSFWTVPEQRAMSICIWRFVQPPWVHFLLLAYSMEQSPWEPDRFSTSQVISRVLCNAEVLFRVYKSPPPLPVQYFTLEINI